MEGTLDLTLLLLVCGLSVWFWLPYWQGRQGSVWKERQAVAAVDLLPLKRHERSRKPVSDFFVRRKRPPRTPEWAEPPALLPSSDAAFSHSIIPRSLFACGQAAPASRGV